MSLQHLGLQNTTKWSVPQTPVNMYVICPFINEECRPGAGSGIPCAVFHYNKFSIFLLPARISTKFFYCRYYFPDDVISQFLDLQTSFSRQLYNWRFKFKLSARDGCSRGRVRVFWWRHCEWWNHGIFLRYTIVLLWVISHNIPIYRGLYTAEPIHQMLNIQILPKCS